MKIIQEILMCPLCQSDLRDNLTCKGCEKKYNFKHGVYDVVSEKLSSNQEHDISNKEYNSYKNSETIEAQKIEVVYMAMSLT